MYIEIKKNKNYKSNIEELKSLVSDIQVREYHDSVYVQSLQLYGYVTRDKYLSGSLILRVGLCGSTNFKATIKMNDILTIYDL